MDEILVNVTGESDSTIGFCFCITYYRKDHLLFTQNEEEVNSWIESIKNIKEKYARMAKREVSQTLRPIEVRIRNHTMGLKVSYNVSLSPQFDCGKDSRIVCIKKK